MNINTTARHFELAQVDRQYAHERLEKCLRFASDIHEAHLVITNESYRYVAEATLRLKQRDLAVREEATEPRRAIDLVADRVEQQLRRLHDKRVHNGRRDGRADGAAPAPATDGDEDTED